MHELIPEFVINIPAEIEIGVLYISMHYATAVHRCCCGCGNEVVTPLSPRDWKLYFDGEGITLQPSIGNSSFACRSHYFIRGNRITWMLPMSDRDIEAARWRGRNANFRVPEEAEGIKPQAATQGVSPVGFFARIDQFLQNLLKPRR